MHQLSVEYLSLSFGKKGRILPFLSYLQSRERSFNLRERLTDFMLRFCNALSQTLPSHSKSSCLDRFLLLLHKLFMPACRCKVCLDVFPALQCQQLSIHYALVKVQKKFAQKCWLLLIVLARLLLFLRVSRPTLFINYVPPLISLWLLALNNSQCTYQLSERIVQILHCGCVSYNFILF